MAQPIVKYTLSKQGRIPEWLSSDSRAFAGQHSISGNKDGYIPRYESPQSRIMLGIAAGEPDPDGTPDDYIGKIASKSDLQAYLIGIGTIAVDQGKWWFEAELDAAGGSYPQIGIRSVDVNNSLGQYVGQITGGAGYFQSGGIAVDGSNVVAAGGVATYTYLWNDSSSLNSITNVCSGNYTVIVTDANGCTI